MAAAIQSAFTSADPQGLWLRASTSFRHNVTVLRHEESAGDRRIIVLPLEATINWRDRIVGAEERQYDEKKSSKSLFRSFLVQLLLGSAVITLPFFLAKYGSRKYRKASAVRAETIDTALNNRIILNDGASRVKLF